MQIESLAKIFDTTEMSVKHPFSPEGFLFTYYPNENPSNVHYHDFLEIGYCESGAGLFIVDGEIIPFNGKCVSIIYEGQIHIAKSITPEKSLWHFLYIDLEKLFYKVDPVELKALKCTQYAFYTFPNIIHYQDDPALYHMVSEVMSECAACQENYLAGVRTGRLMPEAARLTAGYLSQKTQAAQARLLRKSRLRRSLTIHRRTIERYSSSEIPAGNVRVYSLTSRFAAA